MKGYQEDAASWSRRYKANVEKLGSGDLARVAEVVDDLERRQREHGLPAGEKRMLQKARDLRQRLSRG
jgi:CarD family transcriptional regulator